MEGEFLDAESQVSFKEETLSIRFLALEHLRRILNLASNEWRGGIYERTAQGAEKYLPDTRAEYWNAVNAFQDILLPRMKKEEKAKIANFTVKDKELFNKWFQRHPETHIPIPRFEDGIEKYKDERVILKRELFQELMKILHRLNYLGVKEIMDIATFEDK